MIKKSRFKKIMSARRRKLDIINYRAEKLSRKDIEKENRSSDLVFKRLASLVSRKERFI